MCKVASSSSQKFSWKSSIEEQCLTLSERTALRMSSAPCPSLIPPSLQKDLELQPHRAKADSLFQGSSPRWIQTKSFLARTFTLEAALTLALVLLGQTAFLEAAQDLEGTLTKERPHIRTQEADLPPGTLQEISTVSEADHLAILDTS